MRPQRVVESCKVVHGVLQASGQVWVLMSVLVIMIVLVSVPVIVLVLVSTIVLVLVIVPVLVPVIVLVIWPLLCLFFWCPLRHLVRLTLNRLRGSRELRSWSG